MKKPSLIIGKKQIIMTCLTLMLAIAVYINYTAAPKISDEPDTKIVTAENDTVSYGETEFVNAETESLNASGSDYFAQARLDKMNNRDTAVQTLKSI
ncbi:MAG: SpoIIIAH-like family protein, partial [Ruminococcus sp.]|nr:SpoIIIAH-like family protein [Ruminococcus sp.]